MRCCICNKEISDYGNNPYPICFVEDSDSRCCDECNVKVIQARIMSMKNKNNKYNIGDTIAIFWTSESTMPVEHINNTESFITGVIEDIKADGKGTYFTGTWGNYKVRPMDSFTFVE